MSMNLPLQTKRLTIRDFEVADWEAVHSYGSECEVVQYLPFGPNSEEDTKNFVQKVIAFQRDEPRQDFHLAAILKAEKQLIGGCRIAVLDQLNRGGSIGYCFNRHFWGKGYATEAARALLDFGFEQLDLHRIFATCSSENIASARVLEKIGMRQEGYIREHEWIKGKWRDSLIYAILEHEWS